MARNWWKTGGGPDLGRLLFNGRYAIACEWARGSVVDAACGYGLGTWMLGRTCDQALGLDRDAKGIEAAQRYNTSSRVRFEAADITTYDYPECDWVVSLETLEHIPDRDALLAKFKEAARVGLVLSVPIVPDLTRSKGNFHNTTPAEMDGWFKGRGWARMFDGRHQDLWHGIDQEVYKVGVWTRR